MLDTNTTVYSIMRNQRMRSTWINTRCDFSQSAEAHQISVHFTASVIKIKKKKRERGKK